MASRDNKQYKNPILNKYRKKHRDQPAIIYACGPSLNTFDLSKLNIEDHVSIVMKKAILATDKYSHIDYYFFGDRNNKSLLYEHLIKKLTCIKFGLIYQNGVIMPDKTYDLGFCTENEAYGLSISYDMGFQKDIAENPMYRCSTIFPCLQFALWAGCTTIYVVGMDCTQEHSFMDQTSRGKGQNLLLKMPEHLSKFMHFKKSNYPKSQIVHVNPVNLKHVFDKELYV